jgi:hypothetical protein
MTQDDRRKWGAGPVSLRMPGRHLVAEHDRPRGKRKRYCQEKEGVRAEETPQKGEARHGRTIGTDRRNSERFRYESRMSCSKIPLQGEKNGYPEGSR